MYPLSAALPGKPKSTDRLVRLHPRTYGCPGCSPSLGRTLHQRHKKQNCKRRRHKRRQRNRIFYRMYPSLLLLPKFSNQSRAPGKGYHCQKTVCCFFIPPAAGSLQYQPGNAHTVSSPHCPCLGDQPPGTYNSCDLQLRRL